MKIYARKFQKESGGDQWAIEINDPVTDGLKECRLTLAITHPGSANHKLAEQWLKELNAEFY